MIVNVSEDFLKWCVSNEYGTLIGIREDAPDEIKKEYDEYVKATHQYTKEGFLIR